MTELSLCIPTYNGFPYIKKLLEELCRSPRADIEIVISDDGSSDQTWVYLESAAATDPRLVISKNPSTLGMDNNFAKCVALATGKYIWLCGQDDFIFNAGVDAVLDYLKKNPQVDFIHANSLSVEEGKDMFPVAPTPGSRHVTGVGLEAYLRHSHDVLPTFLPQFILRKSLWDSVPSERYFGTCYCQVGVFLEVSRHFNWCFLDGNYVIGLIPQGGWQHKPGAFAKITFGAYIVFARVHGHTDWLDTSFIRRQYAIHWKQLIKSCLLVRRYHIPIEPALLNELKSAIKLAPLLWISVSCLLSAPRPVSMLLLSMIRVRHIIRSW